MTPEDTAVKLAVHDATLAKTALVEEPFLKQGQGSAFVSRPNELVVLAVTDGGLPAIQQKVVQLVERGFHNIIVALKGVTKLERDSLKLILKTRSYVENWAGSLWICEASPEVVSLMKVMSVEQTLDAASTRQQAVERYKRDQSQEATMSAPTDAVPAVTREQAAAAQPARAGNTTSADEIRLDWDGPESEPAAAAPAKPAAKPAPAKPAAKPAPEPMESADELALEGTVKLDLPAFDKDPKTLPDVDVAELVVHADELPKLDRQIESVLARGKKYVTMRLHFKKRMKTEDVTILTQVRDQLKAAGGQLALASLQQDVATWLKLLDYDREFLIFEDVDSAEVAHKRHAAKLPPVAAAGKAAAPAKAAPAAPGAASADYTFASRSPTSVTIRAPGAKPGAGARKVQAPLTVIRLARVAIESLAQEAVRLAASGTKDIVVDLRNMDAGQRERMEPLIEAALLAEKQGARLTYSNCSREVRAFLKVLGIEPQLPLQDDEDQAFLAHARKIRSGKAFDELELTITRSELGGPTAQTPLPVPRALAELPRDKPQKLLPPAKDGKGQEAEVARLKDEIARLEAALAARKPEPVAEVQLGDVSFAAPSQEEHDRLVDEVSRLSGEAEAAKDATEKLEARLREADYARNEAVAIARSSDEARKRLQGKIDELEKALADAKKAPKAEPAKAPAAAGPDPKMASRIAELESMVTQLDSEQKKAAEERKGIDSYAADLTAERDKLRAQLGEAEKARDEALARPAKGGGDEARALQARLAEVQKEKAILEAKVAEVEKTHKSHVSDTETHTRKLGEVEREKNDLAARVKKHEAEAKEHREKLRDLETQLAKAKADVSDDASEAKLAAKGDTGGLVDRVRALEREKAEILLESKREIERLTKEQDALRGELESAGEMIERLGKELELT